MKTHFPRFYNHVFETFTLAQMHTPKKAAGRFSCFAHLVRFSGYTPELFFSVKMLYSAAFPSFRPESNIELDRRDISFFALVSYHFCFFVIFAN